MRPQISQIEYVSKKDLEPKSQKIFLFWLSYRVTRQVDY